MHTSTKMIRQMEASASVLRSIHYGLTQVLVSYSKGGLGELLQGSVATYLTHHCSRPVAVLHLRGEAATMAATATAAPTGGDGGGRNLLVPVDGSDESFASLRWTLDHLYMQGTAVQGRRSGAQGGSLGPKGVAKYCWNLDLLCEQGTVRAGGMEAL